MGNTTQQLSMYAVHFARMHWWAVPLAFLSTLCLLTCKSTTIGFSTKSIWSE
ncbi:hypothetical protein Y695_00124 [Hydrogenophaga sp. T4]|nr:hypothetical protein Y695_00124 [Hydrogenophaga sp. T4]